MKKLFLILIAFLMVTSLTAKDEYETDIIFDKDVSFSALAMASYSFTFIATGETCLSSATATGYTTAYMLQSRPIACDSVKFYVEIIGKDSIGQSRDSLALQLRLQPMTPGGFPLPSDTITFYSSYLPVVLTKYAGQGASSGQTGAVTTYDNAMDARSLAFTNARLWLRLGYAGTAAQTIKVRIWMQKMWKDRD